VETRGRDVTWRPLVCCLLVLLAGCGGFAGNGEPTRTLTPAEVPTETATETPEPRLAPGMTEAGVVDPVSLAAAHATTLRKTAYTAVWNASEWTRDGTLRYRTTTSARVGTAQRRYHYVNTNVRNGTTRRVERWSDGDRALVRSANGTVTVARGRDGQSLSPEQALPIDLTAERGIERVFQAMETRVVDRTQVNGTTHYRLEGEGIQEPNLTPLRNASLSAVVDERGVVHRYRLAYTTTRGGETVRVVAVVRFREIGTTDVERPSWVPPSG